MHLIALWMILAASTRVELVDEDFTIPPAEWRYVEVELKQTPVSVNCDFQTPDAAAGVRVELLQRAELELLRAGKPHHFVVATRTQPQGGFRYHLRVPGEYAVMVDNRAQPAPAHVHLKVSLDFSDRPDQGVRYLSPGRRLAVILISFAVFFGIVTWSARKLLRAIR